MMHVSFDGAITSTPNHISTEACTHRLKIYCSQSYTFQMNSIYMKHFTLFILIENTGQYHCLQRLPFSFIFRLEKRIGDHLTKKDHDFCKHDMPRVRGWCGSEALG